MSSANQGDGFIEVTRGRKKRKASTSPMRPRQPKQGSSEPPLGTPVSTWRNPRTPQTLQQEHDSNHYQWC